MLEIRTTCENCNKKLPNHSSNAMICSYECTFCEGCVNNILLNVCPNCGGGFEKRPTRPKLELIQNSERKDIVFKPIKINTFLKNNKNIDPRKR